MLSTSIRIRRNNSLGPQELCQSKSCLGPSTQSQLAPWLTSGTKGTMCDAAAAEKRWKKERGKGPTGSDYKAQNVCTVLVLLAEKPPSHWGCWTIFDYDRVWKAPWGGIEGRPEPLLPPEREEARRGGAAAATTEEGSQLSKFRKLSLALCSEWRRCVRRGGGGSQCVSAP